MKLFSILAFVCAISFATIQVFASENIIDEVTLADTSHLFLVPGAQTLENGFGSDTSISSATELSTITVLTTDDVAKPLASVAAAYRTINPLFNLVITTAATAGLVHSGFLGSNLYDFAVLTTVPTAADYEILPSLEYMPMLAVGMGPIYNLPPSFTNSFPFRLTGSALCRIFRGNITVWSDPVIVALNPNMNWAKMSPTQRIEVITISVVSGVNTLLTGYCSKIDPIFASQIGATSLGTKYLAPFQTPRTNLAIVADVLSDHAYSITVTTIPRALAVPLSLVTLVNGASDLDGDTQSVELAVIELASKSSSFAVDLTNPTNQQAWPMSSLSYLYLDNANARVTCYDKRILLEFLIWIYSNDLPRSLFTQGGMVPLPDIIESHFDLLSHLRNDILCDNAALVSANAATLFVSADAASTSLVSIYTSFYKSIDSSYSFATRTLPESLSLERLRVNEAAFALVRTGLFIDADLDMVNRNGFVSIPAFMTGIVPIFNLPTEIQLMYLNTTGQLFYALPDLYPLVLDISTLTRIFLGNITSWLDSDLIALNPQLGVWFKVTQASTNLTVIVGATGESDPSAAAKVLFSAMHSSDVAQRSSYRKIFGSATESISNNAAWKNTINQNPFALVLDPTYVDVPPTNFIMLDWETRLSVKTSLTPGAISYRSIGSQGIGVSDPTVEFRMIQTNTAGAREVVSGTTANMNLCNVPHFDSNAVDAAGGSLTLGTIGTNPLLDINGQREWISPMTPPPGCYPLFVVISIVMPMQYTSNDSGTTSSTSTSTTTSTTTATASSLSGGSSTCLMAEHGIEFANYIQSTASLSLPAEQLGLVRLASSDIVKQLSQSVFYSSTCDSQPVLVTVSSSFSISAAISEFGIAMGTLGLITTAVSIVLVIIFRHRVIIRSSSVPFLLLILLGIGLIFVSLIAWSKGPSPTSASCSAFVWFSQIGLMMVYIPLFAKTYRVWRIFSGSHLKVVKISNHKLLLMSLAAIGVDMVTLAIWQGVSPIQPIEYTRQLNDHWDYYTHCSVDSKGLPFVIIEAVYKAGILLFGALMAFSTRNVKATFNESTQIAWSIYNTLLAAIIVAIMITFLNAIQSTLIILVQIFLLWVTFCTWGLLFIPKFQLLFKSEKEVIETSMSELLPQEKSNGYSFASVAFMSGSQLKSYYEALKTQVIKVQQRLGIAISKFEPAGATETIGAINSKGTNSSLGGAKHKKGSNYSYDPQNTTKSGLNEKSSQPGSMYIGPNRPPTFHGNKVVPQIRPNERSLTGSSESGTPRSLTGSNPPPNQNLSRAPSPVNTPAGSPLVSAMKTTITQAVLGNQMVPRLGVASGRQSPTTPLDGSTTSAINTLPPGLQRRDSQSSTMSRYQPIHVKSNMAKQGTSIQARLSMKELSGTLFRNDSNPSSSSMDELRLTTSPTPTSPPKTPLQTNQQDLPPPIQDSSTTMDDRVNGADLPPNLVIRMNSPDMTESIDLSHMTTTNTEKSHTISLN